MTRKRPQYVALGVAATLILSGYGAHWAFDELVCIEQQTPVRARLATCDCELEAGGQWVYGECQEYPIDLSRASYVALVEVVDAGPDRASEDDLHSFVEFRVVQPIRGDFVHSRLIVRSPDQRSVDQQSEILPIAQINGAPFARGENVILFLEDYQPDGSAMVLNSRIYRVHFDQEIGEMVVRTKPKDIQFFRAEDSTPYRTLQEEIPISDFIFSIQTKV